jgi:hypothetical protein
VGSNPAIPTTYSKLFSYMPEVHDFSAVAISPRQAKEEIMATDNPSPQGGMSAEAAANAGRQAALSGQGLMPQQPDESADAYAQRQFAYNEAKKQQQQH